MRTTSSTIFLHTGRHAIRDFVFKFETMSSLPHRHTLIHHFSSAAAPVSLSSCSCAATPTQAPTSPPLDPTSPHPLTCLQNALTYIMQTRRLKACSSTTTHLLSTLMINLLVGHPYLVPRHAPHSRRRPHLCILPSRNYPALYWPWHHSTLTPKLSKSWPTTNFIPQMC